MFEYPYPKPDGTSDTYEVRFWFQKPDGYWEQRKKIYRANGKCAHEEVNERWEKEFPGAKHICTTYQ